MTHKTINDLIGAIAERAGCLADQPIDHLRSSYPEVTETQSELIRYCRDYKFSRGDMVSAILLEEFSDARISES